VRASRVPNAVSYIGPEGRREGGRKEGRKILTNILLVLIFAGSAEADVG